MNLPSVARVAATLILSTLPLSACGSIPADSVGTFDRATGGDLVVGLSEHSPWAEFDRDSGTASGSEVELIESFADSIDAEIQWRPGPESVLAHSIKEGEIDLLIGGLTATSPWSTHMALTRPYGETTAENGSTEKMVMGVRLGENELLTELERHLAEEAGEI